jgi:hypothetical protein
MIKWLSTHKVQSRILILLAMGLPPVGLYGAAEHGQIFWMAALLVVIILGAAAAILLQ